MPHVVRRRTLIAGIPILVASVAMRQPRIEAQDATPAAIGTPSAEGGGIRPTSGGEVPSTGASRPGPADMVQEQIDRVTIAPVGLTVESVGIDAGIEALRVVDGAMQDPTGPWVVAWYENLGSLGVEGNIVMAGHIDYWNVGPAVFYNLATLQAGDEASVSGADGKIYPFIVESVQQYDYASMPLDEVVGPTGEQSLTLITCGGAFDFATGQYLQRTVVRANRSGPGVAEPA